MDTRYLLHVTEADRWPAVLSNVKNLTALGLAGSVTVVINGSAIHVVQGTNDWATDMATAAAAGVTFEICSRAMANHDMPVDTIPDWLVPVPAALPAIAEHVHDGFVYVKP